MISRWALCAIAFCAVVRAQAPPGFYRVKLGDFEITALIDGVVAYPTSRLLPTATPEQIKRGLIENGLEDPAGMSYNAFLVNTGSKLILIDTGTGGKLDDQPEFHGAGHLLHVAGGPEKQDISRPAEFLLDPSGTIRWVNFTDDIRVRARSD